jgi:hypothetical protein
MTRPRDTDFEGANEVMWRAQEQLLTRLGFDELLYVKAAQAGPE